MIRRYYKDLKMTKLFGQHLHLRVYISGQLIFKGSYNFSILEKLEME